MMDMSQWTDSFERTLLQIDRVQAKDLFADFHRQHDGFQALEVLTAATLERIGGKWEEGTVSLSQVYMSGVICEELIEDYLPRLSISRKNDPRLAIAVLLDHHALGKRIVTSIVRAGGYDLLDFGQGVEVDELVRLTLEHRVEILLISTLMLPSALRVREVREKLTAAGSRVKIVVGGAPFRLDGTLWESVGADADGKNASDILGTLEAMTAGGR